LETVWAYLPSAILRKSDFKHRRLKLIQILTRPTYFIPRWKARITNSNGQTMPQIPLVKSSNYHSPALKPIFSDKESTG